LGEDCCDCCPNEQGDEGGVMDHAFTEGETPPDQTYALPRPPLLYCFWYKTTDCTKWLKAMPKFGIRKAKHCWVLFS